MASHEAGTVHVPVLPSLRGFHSEIKAETSRIKDVTVKIVPDFDQSQLQKQFAKATQGIHVDVTPKFNTGQAVAGAKATAKQIQTALDREQIRAKIDADIALINAKDAEVRKRLQELENAKPSPTIDADITAVKAKIALVNSELDELRRKESTPKVEADIAVAEAKLVRLNLELDALGNKRASFNVDVDVAKARADLVALELQRAALDAKRTDIEVNVDTDRAVGGLRQVSRSVQDADGSFRGGLVSASAFARSLGTFAAPTAIIAALPIAIAAVAAALAALPAIATAGAGAIGTLALGFSGVSDAVGALKDQEEQGAATATAAAAERRAALQRVQSAVQSLDDAQRAADRAAITGAAQLADARKAVEDAIAASLQRVRAAEADYTRTQQAALAATKALTQARADARQELEDLTLSLRGASLSEEEAVDRLEEARQRLAEAKGSGASAEAIDDLDRAVRQSELGLDEARVRYERLQQESAEYAKTGVEGSQRVQAAHTAAAAAAEREAAAAAAVRQAEAEGARQVADARLNQARVEQQVAWQQQDATLQLTRAVESLREAHEQTGTAGAAAANKVAVAMAALSPIGQQFAQFIHSELLPAFDEVKFAAQAGLLPGVEAGLRQLMGIFPTIAAGVQSIGVSLGGLFQSFTSVVTSAQGVAQINTILQGTAGWLTGMQPLVTTFTQSWLTMASVGIGELGSFTTALQGVADAWQQMVDRTVANGTFQAAIRGLAQILEAFGQVFVQVIEAGLGNMTVLAGPISAAVRAFGDLFVALNPILLAFTQLLLGVLTPVINALIPVIDALVPPFQLWAQMLGDTLAQAMQAVAPLLASIGQTLADVWMQALRAMQPVLPILVQAFAQLVQNLMPLVPMIGQIATQLIAGLAPILPVIANALLQWMVAVTPLLPALIDLVMAVVTPLIGLLPQLVPLFTQLINAAVLLMPPVLDLVTVIVQSFTPGIQALMPIITQLVGILAQALTGVLQYVVVPLIRNVVVPAIQFFADTLRWFKDNVITPVWGFIGDTVGGVLKWISDKLFDGKAALDTLGKAFDDFGRFLQRIYDRYLKPIFDKIGEGLDALNKVPGLRAVVPGAAGGGVVGMAGGGVLPGYAPGRDTVPTLLSRGEGVLVPEAVRMLGPDTILALNKAASGRPAAQLSGGGIARFAGGGIAAPAGAAPTFLAATGPNVPLDPRFLQDSATATGMLTTAVQSLTATALQPLAAELQGVTLPILQQTQLQAGVATAGAIQALQATLPPLTLTTQTAGAQMQATWAANTAQVQLSQQQQTANYGLLRTNLGAATLGMQQSIGQLQGASNASWQNIATTTQQQTGFITGPVFTGLHGGMTAVEQHAGGLANAWTTQLGRFRPAAADPVRWIMQFPLGPPGIAASYNHLDDVFKLGKRINPPAPGFAEGGPIRGAGSGTSDSITARVSAGEFVVREAVASRIPRFLMALNAGQAEAIQAAGGPGARMPGYAQGGLIAVRDFAQRNAGRRYKWGGVGPDGWDCSGWISSLVRVARGDPNPFQRVGDTNSFPWGGFQGGLGGSFSVGAHKGNPGHMAGTVGGTNTESGGSHNTSAWGPPAVGADSPQFNIHAFLPEIAGKFVSGGAGGGSFDPTPVVDEAFAKTYAMVNDIVRFFGDANTTLGVQGVTRQAVDGVRGKALEQLAAAMGGGLGPIGAGGPFYIGEISRAAKGRRLGVDGAIIGVATALVESGLKMYANSTVPASLNFPHDAVGSDHDSVGLFQQRQAGWGTLDQRMNAFASAGLFFDAMLRKFPNWRGMDPGAVAQGVQVSAYPARYSTRMGQARQLVAQFGGPFDTGGVASGVGLLPKLIQDPERVLNPQDTRNFDTLVSVLGRSGVKIGWDGATGDAPLIGTLTQHISGGDPDEVARSVMFEVRRARQAGRYSRAGS